MEVVLLDVWVVLGFYCALCIWIPEIRLFGWRYSGTKFGTVSYVGLAVFLWSPALAITGLISKENRFVLCFVMFFAGLVTVIGYFTDRNDG
jgi:uncharacterized membrane protein